MPENMSGPSEKSPRGLLYGIAAIVLLGLAASFYFLKRESAPAETPQAETVVTPDPAATPAPSGSPSTTDPTAANSKAPDLSVDAAGLSKATVTIETQKGKIKFHFYPKDAPKTTARIIELIQSGFYNGLTFHRVEPGFVIQGGDPNGNGTGGSGTKLKAEFNAHRHIAGTVAMARAQDPDSADSQFYIALDQAPHLDGSYTVFGQVSEGLDVVQKIEIGDKMTKVTVE